MIGKAQKLVTFLVTFILICRPEIVHRDTSRIVYLGNCLKQTSFCAKQIAIVMRCTALQSPVVVAEFVLFLPQYCSLDVMLEMGQKGFSRTTLTQSVAYGQASNPKAVMDSSTKHAGRYACR